VNTVIGQGLVQAVSRQGRAARDISGAQVDDAQH